MLNHNVARNIWHELGGSQFKTMTGATDFVASDNSLMFRLPNKSRTKPNKCVITLNGFDLYDMEFYRVNARKGTFVKLSEIRNIYNDQIQEVFSQKTGLATKL